MTVAEVAESTGIPARTIRYYDAQGLVCPPKKRKNGYRAYTPQDVAELRLVARARHVGLSLDDCRRLLEGWRAGSKGRRDEMDYTLAAAEVACVWLRDVG